MKKILMSFWPSVYDRIVAQTKIIEFRHRYSDEETIVYMYVSKPCKAIKGVAVLGKRVDMSKVSVNSAFYSQAIRDGYQADKFTYGMPICSVQTITPLSLDFIKSQIPRFNAPQSYYYLDNDPELLQLIESNVKPISECVYNAIVLPEEIE